MVLANGEFHMSISVDSVTKLLISVLTLSGLGIIVVSCYVALKFGIGFPLATFSLFGFALVIVGSLLYSDQYLDYSKVTIRDKEYSLNHGLNSKRTDIESKSSDLESIEPFLRDISDQLEKYEDYQLNYYDNETLQQSINILNKQLAIREYGRSVGPDNDLRVVKYENDFVVAKSKRELSLAKGLKFNILSDDGKDSHSDGRIATAELVETESTSGKLFEFQITDWKKDKDDWRSRAEIDLEKGNARMSIITEDLVDIEEDKLRTAITCLQKIKNDWELKYEY